MLHFKVQLKFASVSDGRLLKRSIQISRTQVRAVNSLPSTCHHFSLLPPLPSTLRDFQSSQPTTASSKVLQLWDKDVANHRVELFLASTSASILLEGVVIGPQVNQLDVIEANEDMLGIGLLIVNVVAQYCNLMKELRSVFI